MRVRLLMAQDGSCNLLCLLCFWWLKGLWVWLNVDLCGAGDTCYRFEVVWRRNRHEKQSLGAYFAEMLLSFLWVVGKGCVWLRELGGLR